MRTGAAEWTTLAVGGAGSTLSAETVLRVGTVRIGTALNTNLTVEAVGLIGRTRVTAIATVFVGVTVRNRVHTAVIDRITDKVVTRVIVWIAVHITVDIRVVIWVTLFLSQALHTGKRTWLIFVKLETLVSSARAASAGVASTRKIGVTSFAMCIIARLTFWALRMVSADAGPVLAGLPQGAVLIGGTLGTLVKTIDENTGLVGRTFFAGIFAAGLVGRTGLTQASRIAKRSGTTT